jgi:Amt family ammonium transporter
VIGIASGAICWYAAAVLKQRLGYDDSLDVFGVHGVGGFVGTVLAGVLAAGAFGGLEGDLDIGSQVGKQLLAALITVGYTAVATYLLLKVTGTIVPLRVESREELEGLDLSLHNEAGYNL